MQLKHIKLSGFKSFVDPTKISFPTNMVGVVGPNGCGKSNVIDAIRWVLGELSAKNLRGESMVDVIFNGSENRKASGQCSIELLFDNSSAKIGGEYASFNEVSIKRVMTRDAQSDYFINNTKCRRKDVQDIFLGTGLGPSSYAIIEQGMVSKLVSAKPDELRTHIEEAAGVSKYRERRRETESRIKRTKENLSRVKDIKDEMVSLNKEINWKPKSTGEGRFGNWIEGAIDWAISRNRVWGTPLPIWINDVTEYAICIGSTQELEAYTGIKVSDLHREFVDDLTFSVDGEEGVYRRIEEVLDCWFESGAMPYAQLHYPFENEQLFEEGFPACLLYTSPSPRDATLSRMPSSA